MDGKKGIFWEFGRKFLEASRTLAINFMLSWKAVRIGVDKLE